MHRSGPAACESIEMALTKIGRISTGEFVEDNYDDIIGYVNLARNQDIRNKEDVTEG